LANLLAAVATSWLQVMILLRHWNVKRDGTQTRQAESRLCQERMCVSWRLNVVCNKLLFTLGEVYIAAAAAAVAAVAADELLRDAEHIAFTSLLPML